jgi:lysophospholipase L1-like esterase
MSDYFPQCHIINAGRGGATSSDMAEAIQDAMAETSDILIVSVGVNNYHRGSESRILQDIASMIEKARSINPDVEIYITGITPTLSMNEWNLKIACINPEIESLCAKSGVAYLSIADMESGIALAAPYTSDGVHYTAAGYDVLARIIKSAVGI